MNSPVAILHSSGGHVGKEVPNKIGHLIVDGTRHVVKDIQRGSGPMPTWRSHFSETVPSLQDRKVYILIWDNNSEPVRFVGAVGPPPKTLDVRPIYKVALYLRGMKATGPQTTQRRRLTREQRRLVELGSAAIFRDASAIPCTQKRETKRLRGVMRQHAMSWRRTVDP